MPEKRMNDEEFKIFKMIAKCAKSRIYIHFRPDLIKNPITGHNLEFDFYLPKLGLAIEYQGHHHFSEKTTFKNNIDRVTYHDMLKIDLIKKLNEGRKKNRQIVMVWLFKEDSGVDIISFFDILISRVALFDCKSQSKRKIINRLIDRKNSFIKRKEQHEIKGEGV